jgi:glycosyltransferase involved in cell wall biosynthesis
LILCEGWRFVPHSFALVNQFQILALLDLGVSIAVRDRPYWVDWRPVYGILPDELEDRLKALGEPPLDVKPAAVIRVSSPYDFATDSGVPTLVMMTAEAGKVRQENVAGSLPLAKAIAASDALIHAPSRWSRDGLVASGIPPERIAVIGHGADTDLWRPADEARRAEQRRRFGWQDDFVLLNIGAMTGNKGIDILLDAFAGLLETHPRARLVLKGIDALFRSRDQVRQFLNDLPASARSKVADRLTYFGGSLALTDLVRLYQSADAYVSPYRAEGFNLPVLEAAACGLPVICTAGGATDDFTEPDFALRVDAALDEAAHALSPSREHLLIQLRRCVDDDGWRRVACDRGASFIAAHHTWRHAADGLLRAVGLSGEAKGEGHKASGAHSA